MNGIRMHGVEFTINKNLNKNGFYDLGMMLA